VPYILLYLHFFFLQETLSLKSDLTRAKNDLQISTTDYMREIKGLKEKLKEYEIERM